MRYSFPALAFALLLVTRAVSAAPATPPAAPADPDVRQLLADLRKSEVADDCKRVWTNDNEKGDITDS